MINCSRFIGKEVSEMLGHARPTKAILDQVDTENKDEFPIQDFIGSLQNTPIFNEKRSAMFVAKRDMLCNFVKFDSFKRNAHETILTKYPAT